MTAKVKRGPWTSPVRQSSRLHRALERGKWWYRDAEGALWVVKRHEKRSYQVPVPMADLDPSRPLPPSARNDHGCIVPVAPHPTRITMALDAQGMDGPEVDVALGVSTPDDHVVDAWEAGTLVPTLDEVRRLAWLTGMQPWWFYQGPAPEVDALFVCAIPDWSEPPQPCPTCGGSGSTP